MIGYVLVGLLLFGLAYNSFVAFLENRHHDQGYTAVLVAVGVFVTVAATALLIPVNDVLIVLLAFAASGTPMFVGSIWRHVQRREAEARELLGLAKELLNDGD